MLCSYDITGLCQCKCILATMDLILSQAHDVYVLIIIPPIVEEHVFIIVTCMDLRVIFLILSRCMPYTK